MYNPSVGVTWAFGGCGYFPPCASRPIVQIGRVPKVIRIMCGGGFMAVRETWSALPYECSMRQSGADRGETVQADRGGGEGPVDWSRRKSLWGITRLNSRNTTPHSRL